jgi:hypothetical protein
MNLPVRGPIVHFVACLRPQADFLVIMRFGVENEIRPMPLLFYCIAAELKPAFVCGQTT